MEKEVEKFIEKATFSEVYKVVKGRNNSELLKCFCGVFKAGLLFLPGLLMPEVEPIVNLGNAVNIIGAAETITSGVKGVYEYFKDRNYNDYKTRYNDMQIAHYLIVYAAFFDTIKEYLPDESGKINLMGNEKVFITKEAIKKYRDSLKIHNESENIWTNSDVIMPSPLCSFDTYLKNLKTFYKFYSNEFFNFFRKLECWESLTETEKEGVVSAINSLPDNAVQNYKKQYYELSRCFRDFEIWTNQKKMQYVERKIDVGFNTISKSISHMIENSQTKVVVDILERCHKEYFGFISKSIISGDTDNITENGTVLPSKSSMFVPQQFKSVRYTDGMKLEPNSVWESSVEQDNIGEFISGVLHHPESNTMPLIVLGVPGAGKSLLCNMLAAKLLYQEYHVIIVTLRDARADDTIVQQITDQINRMFGESCSWYDISKAKLDKPILIIFDGYDELLQSSGKTYSHYINKISEFQKLQLNTCNMQVKCIITSRITLIDKAYIPNGSIVLRLCDFDRNRIDEWITIWNSHNKSYFSNNNLKEFSLPKNGKILELARQPLLLMMLALYDSNDNKLDKQKDLTQTQLYDNLIRDFVAREKRKEEDFKNLTCDMQEKAIDVEVTRIGIAAIGMYNRNIYHIVSEQLNSDIKYYKDICGLIDFIDTSEEGLTEAEKLLGSFFFMHKSLSTEHKSTEKKEKSAYEFLHNTFGEFLTANFIFNNVYNVIEEISFSNKNNRSIRWNDIFSNAWYSSLIYTPLFSKPVVVSMLKEWSSLFFAEKNLEKSEIKKILNDIINNELSKIINGEIFNSIYNVINKRENVYPNTELLVHIANYSINLLILGNVLTHDSANIELYKPLNEHTLEKLIHIWKYAFNEDQLLDLSHLFVISKRKNSSSNLLAIKYKVNDNKKDKNGKLQALYDISYSIGDEVIQALSGCLIGNYKNEFNVLGIIQSCNLDIKNNYYLSVMVNELLNKKSYHYLLNDVDKLLCSAIDDNCHELIYLCCIITEYMLENLMDFENPVHYNYFIKLCRRVTDFYSDNLFIRSSPFSYHSTNIFIEYIWKLLSNKNIADKYFAELFRKIDILKLMDESQVNPNEIKCINRYVQLINNMTSKDVKYLYFNISKILRLSYMGIAEYDELTVINELIKLNCALFNFNVNIGLDFYNKIKSKRYFPKYLIKYLDTDSSLFSELCFNYSVLLKLAINCDDNSKKKPLYANILYCINVCEICALSSEKFHEIVKMLNQYNFNKHDIYHFNIDNKLLNYVDEKKENISIPIVNEIKQFSKKYSCVDLIERLNSLFL